MKFNEGTFENPPLGIHPAVCTRVIDLGTQVGEYKGKPTKTPTMVVTWELANARRTDGTPFTINKWYSKTKGANSHYMLHLAGWAGKKVDFVEPCKLIGRTCQLVITEKNEKPAVNTVAPPSKEFKDYKPEGETFCFDLEKFDQELFDSLNDFYKEKIMASPEYAEAVGQEFSGEPEAKDGDEEEFDW